jgi:hypothetical protein
VERSNTVQKTVEVTRVCTCSGNCALCIKCSYGIRDVICEKQKRVYEDYWNVTVCRLLNICQCWDYRGATLTRIILVRYFFFLKQCNGIVWITCENIVTGIKGKWLRIYNELEQ